MLIERFRLLVCSFQLGRTLPVRIRISDCVSGNGVNTLAPEVSLALIDLGGGAVNELISSSAADDGTTMRSTRARIFVPASIS